MKIYLNCLLNVKLWVCLAAIDMTFVWQAFNKYVFSDINYIKWLIIAMILDLLTGITKVWVLGGWMGYRNITSRGLRDTISKGWQYASFLIGFHLLTSFEINNIPINIQFNWINKVVFEFIIMIELKSVYENLVKINPKLDFVKMIFLKIYNSFFKKEGEDPK